MAASGSRTLKLSILADVDQLKKSLATANDDVSSSASKIGDFSKKVGAAFVVAGAAAAAYAGKLLVDGVKAAIEDQAAQEKLATTLENVTGATNGQIKAVEDYITKTSLANGVTDDKLRPSLDRLVRSTKDVTEAQNLQALALDISAGTGKDLQAVSEALAKAHDGNFAALKKLGVSMDESIIKSKDFDAATAALASTFENQASKQAETFQGKMDRLSIAFNEAKETVGGYILDALTPLLDGFVNKGIPAIQGFANSIGKDLAPVFADIFKVIRDDVLPVLTTWWKFIIDEIIPTIASVVKPILKGLSDAFDTIKKAITDNSAELQPFYDALESVWDFIKKYLAPLLGGAFKMALQAIGDIVGGLVTGFSKLVGFISNTVDKIKAFIKLVTDNPVTRFFFGDSNDKSLKASVSFDATATSDSGTTTVSDTGFPTNTSGGGFNPGADPYTFTGAPLSAYSPAMQQAILNREAAKARTAELIAAREKAAADRLALTGGLSTADRITINVSGAIDPEGTARTIVNTLNDSYYRGTNGAGSLQFA